MEVSVFETNEYIPEWNKNQEDENPIVIEHKEPTMDLCSKLLPKPKIKLQIDPEGGMVGGEADMPVDTERMVKRMTLGIRNLTVKKTQKGGKDVFLEIKTVEDLFSPKAPAFLNGLVIELGNYYQKILNKETDTKNSE